jgi:hypothetical protein
VRADTLEKKEQTSDNRVMMLLKQAGLSEAAAYQCRPKDGERASSCPRLGHSNRGVAHYSASARPSNNDAAMKTVTDTLKVTKQADRKRISNRLAIFISDLEDAALNNLDLAPEDLVHRAH